MEKIENDKDGANKYRIFIDTYREEKWGCKLLEVEAHSTRCFCSKNAFRSAEEDREKDTMARVLFIEKYASNMDFYNLYMGRDPALLDNQDQTIQDESKES